MLQLLAAKSLNRFTLAIYGLFRLVLKNSGRSLLLFSILLIFFLAQFPKLRTVFAAHDLVDRSLPQASHLRKLREDFKMGNSVLVIFHAQDKKTGFTSTELNQIQSWITREPLHESEILRVFSPFEIRKAVFTDGKIRYHQVVHPDSPETLKVIQSSPWAGVFTTDNQNDLLIEFVFRDSEMGSSADEHSSFNPISIQRLNESLLREFKSIERFSLSGEAAFQWYSHIGIERTFLLNILLLIIVLTAFRYFFGTWLSGILYSINLGASSIIVFGSMAMLGHPIDLVSSGLFLMIAVAGLEDFMFLSQDRLTYSQSHWRRSFRRLITPGLFTSLTTVIGFSSLYLTDIEILSRFGLWAGFGAALEWVTTFLLIPAILQHFPQLRNWVKPEKAYSQSNWIQRIIDKPLPRRFCKWIVIFGCVLGVWGANHLQTSGSPKEMFTSSHDYSKALAYLKSSRGWEGSIQVVFNEDFDPQRMKSITQELRKHSNVQKVTSPLEMKEWISEGVSDPDVRLMVEREVSLSDEYLSLVNSRNQGRISVYLKDSRLDPMQSLLEEIDRLCQSDCHAAGELSAHSEFSKKIPRAFLKSFGGSFLLIAIVIVYLTFAFNIRRASLPALLATSAWGPLMTTLAVFFAGIRVNFLTCLFASVLDGSAGDNAVQYIFASRRRTLQHGISERGGGAIFMSLFIAIACLVFLGSYFVSPRILGLLLALGMFFALLGDTWLLSGWVQNEKKRISS